MSKPPRFWIVTLSAMLTMGLTCALGLWQMDRAAQKIAWSHARHAQMPVTLVGKWLPELTVYWDNRPMLGKQGFVVVTPLQTSAQDFVWVQRGWIGRDFLDRKKLQPIDTPQGEVKLQARKLPEPLPRKALEDEYPIVQSIHPASLKGPALTHQGMWQQIGPAGEGVLRQWFEPSSGVDKHYGYAFQWFALCATVAALYLWFQWIQPYVARKRTQA